MDIQNALKKYNNFHDSVITKIEIENPNHVSDKGAVSVNPNFKIKIYLDYFQNAKLSDVKESKLIHLQLICKDVIKFKLNKSEVYSYLIFGMDAKAKNDQIALIIDDFDEIICKDIELTIIN